MNSINPGNALQMQWWLCRWNEDGNEWLNWRVTRLYSVVVIIIARKKILHSSWNWKKMSILVRIDVNLILFRSRFTLNVHRAPCSVYQIPLKVKEITGSDTNERDEPSNKQMFNNRKGKTSRAQKKMGTYRNGTERMILDEDHWLLEKGEGIEVEFFIHHHRHYDEEHLWTSARSGCDFDVHTLYMNLANIEQFSVHENIKWMFYCILNSSGTCNIGTLIAHRYFFIMAIERPEWCSRRIKC